jgi:hypothetical protein
MALWVEHERRRSEILTAIDLAKASIDRGEGTGITRESMRTLAEDVKQRGRAQLPASITQRSKSSWGGQRHQRAMRAR